MVRFYLGKVILGELLKNLGELGGLGKDIE
jgi:hypothetical protein